MDKETAKAISALAQQINDLGQRIDNHLNNRVDTTNSVVKVNTDTVGTVMEEMLPEQADKIEQVVETVDVILTEFIPGFMDIEE